VRYGEASKLLRDPTSLIKPPRTPPMGWNLPKHCTFSMTGEAWTYLQGLEPNDLHRHACALCQYVGDNDAHLCIAACRLGFASVVMIWCNQSDLLKTRRVRWGPSGHHIGFLLFLVAVIIVFLTTPPPPPPMSRHVHCATWDLPTLLLLCKRCRLGHLYTPPSTHCTCWD
jgi:hypothetical protein